MMQGVKDLLNKIQPVDTKTVSCIICGEQYEAQHADKVECCSEPCRRIYRRRNLQNKFLKRCNVPKKYLDIDTTVYPQKVKQAVGPFIYIYGHDKGAGKTHTAVCKFYDILTQLPIRSGEFINSLFFYNKLKGAISEGVNPQKVINKYVGPDVLLIDDFGTERITWFIAENMYELIERRSSSGMLTLLTSNKTIREYIESYPENDNSLYEIGDRIASRLSEGQQVKITGKDRRIR